MNIFFNLPWGLILIIPFIIIVFSGRAKKILHLLEISEQTLLLIVFLIIGGSLLSPWYVSSENKDFYVNFGSLLVPLVLFIVLFVKIGKKEKIRSVFAIIFIGLYYFLAKGGYLWKIEEIFPQMVYFFTPLIALIAYIFCGFNKSTFVALIGSVIIGETMITLIIGSSAYQEIFGLEIINLLFLSIFFAAGYSYLPNLPQYLFKRNKNLDSLTNQD